MRRFERLVNRFEHIEHGCAAGRFATAPRLGLLRMVIRGLDRIGSNRMLEVGVGGGGGRWVECCVG